MTKKNWLLISVALALAVAYVFYFTDSFKPKTIHISSLNARPTRAAARAGNPSFIERLATLAKAGANADSTTMPVIFKLGQPCKLTEIKVVALDEWQANKNVLPVWHLVADTNSVPINQPFNYGQNVRGMKPAVPGTHAQPLQPGVEYRLFITDGSAKGQHDFQPVAIPTAATAAPVAPVAPSR
jgi:hypothetical protein